MSIQTRSISAAIAIALFSGGANAATFNVCKDYIQTWSNAGQCPACKLSVTFDEARRAYIVQANNGWKAELSPPAKGNFMAVGRGRWNDGLGHIYSGHVFSVGIFFRDDVAAMMMHVPIDGRDYPINATFNCRGSAL